MSKWTREIKELMSLHPKGKPLTLDGSEYPDPTPQDPPIGYRPEPSMFEVIARMVREEKVRAALEAEGAETPDEADDFDVDDDYEPSSPFEHNFDRVVDPAELARLQSALDLRKRELEAGAGTPTATSAVDDRGGPSAAGKPASSSGPGAGGGPAGG